jgi:hypothetical protein
MTLPIANGLAGSAGQPLPEDAVCDWEGIADLLANARTVGMKML